MAVILGQSLFLPIILAPLTYLIGKRVGSKAGWFAFVVLAYSTIMLLFAGMQGSEYTEVYPWQPIGEFGLKLDGLSTPFAAIIYILSTTLAVYSIPYMKHKVEAEFEHHSPEVEQAIKGKMALYYSLYLLYAAGMLGTVLATNLIQFYIFFELMLIPSFFLIAEFGYGDRYRISLMYFLWTHVGAVILLAAILSIGFLGGGFDFAKISTSGIPEGIRVWLGVAVSLGLFVKMAAVGLHVWLPYAHAEAPTPISALLSPAMIGIGGYAIVRIVMTILPTAFVEISTALAIWAVITMFYGGAMALVQDDVKRLLAYS